MTGMTRHVRAVGMWELRQAVRSRWVAAVALALAASWGALTLLGLRSAGELGMTGTGPASGAIVNLALLVPPLFALLLGLTSVAAGPDRSMLTLLAAQVMPRWALLVASFLGLAATLWLTLLLGFGLSTLVLAGAAPAGDLWPLGAVAAATLGTSTACLAIGILISAAASSRGQATALAVAVWLVLALGLDLAVAGIAPVLRLGPSGLLAAVLVNPVEAGRVLALLGTVASPSVLGPFGGYLRDGFGTTMSVVVLGTSLIAWVVGALSAATIVVVRRDL